MRIPAYKYFLLVIDIALVSVCYILAIWLRFHVILLQEILTSIFLPLVAAFIFQYNDLYKVNIFLDRSASTIKLFKSLLALLVIYIMGAFVSNFALVKDSRLAFLYFGGVLAIAFSLYRVWLLPNLFKKLASLGIRARKVIVVGTGKMAQSFAASVGRNQSLGLHVLGFVDDELPVGTGILNGYKVIGPTDSLDMLVKGRDCDEIVIAVDNISHEKLLSTMTLSKNTGATVRVVSNLVKSISDATTTEAYTLHPTATITRGLYSPVTYIYQRTVDLVLCSIALLVLMPFFLFAAVIIKLTSIGPVFYMHERIGRYGIPFQMFKFRSMALSHQPDTRREAMMMEFMKNGKATNNGSGKVVDESRVTPFGKIMRKTSFDELPQLINVVFGQMSLVGPRPSLPYEYAAMKEWQRERVKVLPGCTGFWQVYGRGVSSFDDMVIMDLYMIENMSPWLYLQYIFKTIPALTLGKGAK